MGDTDLPPVAVKSGRGRTTTARMGLRARVADGAIGGDGLERRPPAGTAARRAAAAKTPIAGMALCPGTYHGATSEPGVLPAARLRRAVPAGGRRSKPSRASTQSAIRSFARLWRAVPAGGRRSKLSPPSCRGELSPSCDREYEKSGPRAAEHRARRPLADQRAGIRRVPDAFAPPMGEPGGSAGRRAFGSRLSSRSRKRRMSAMASVS